MTVNYNENGNWNKYRLSPLLSEIMCDREKVTCGDCLECQMVEELVERRRRCIKSRSELSSLIGAKPPNIYITYTYLLRLVDSMSMNLEIRFAFAK